MKFSHPLVDDVVVDGIELFSFHFHTHHTHQLNRLMMSISSSREDGKDADYIFQFSSPLVIVSSK